MPPSLSSTRAEAGWEGVPRRRLNAEASGRRQWGQHGGALDAGPPAVNSLLPPASLGVSCEARWPDGSGGEAAGSAVEKEVGDGMGGCGRGRGWGPGPHRPARGLLNPRHCSTSDLPGHPPSHPLGSRPNSPCLVSPTFTVQPSRDLSAPLAPHPARWPAALQNRLGVAVGTRLGEGSRWHRDAGVEQGVPLQAQGAGGAEAETGRWT